MFKFKFSSRLELLEQLEYSAQPAQPNIVDKGLFGLTMITRAERTL